MLNAMSVNEKTRTPTGDSDVPSPDRSSATSQTRDQIMREPDAQQQAGHPIPALSGPPNGGRTAWIQVLCGFFLFFNTFGLLTTFGVFQTYYESPSSPFKRSSSDISWIGSIQSFLLQFVGIFAGPIYDKGHLRVLLSVGTFGIVFGHMMLSIASEYWQVLLAQGFCVGLGMGCLYLPSISILPSYFSTRLGLAIGLASSGSGVGGVIFPIVMQRMIDQIGFAWAVRVVGFITLVALSLPVSLMRMRVKPAAARDLIDWSAFADLPFVWFAIATSVGFMGINAFQIFFAFYAAEQQITTTAFAFNLVSIYNGMSAVGRIIPNAVSDKVGQWNILAPATLACSAVYFCAMATHSKGPMIGITLLGGFFLGVLTALPPVCFAILTKDKSKLGTRIGTGFALIAPGVLIGGPGAGGILQRTDPLDWRGLFIFAGTAMFVCSMMYTVLRVARSGFRPFIKA